jgi:hypothetical protein
MNNVLTAAAEQAAVADAALRRARSGLFWLLVSARQPFRSFGAAQLSGKALGGSQEQTVPDECPILSIVPGYFVFPLAHVSCSLDPFGGILHALWSTIVP